MNSHGKKQGIWHHVLFSKTSCFVNTAFKDLEFLYASQPPTSMCFVSYVIRKSTSLCVR